MISAIEWVLYCWTILVTCTISGVMLFGVCWVYVGVREWLKALRDPLRRYVKRYGKPWSSDSVVRLSTDPDIQESLNQQRIREDEAEINRLIRDTR
jgi:hypothetical protein